MLPVLQDALRSVDVLQEQIQRDDALREPALDAVPLGARNDARNQVEGEQALGAAAVAVDGEGDALQQKGEIGELAALLELRRGHARQFLENLGVMRPGLPGRPQTSRRRTNRDRNPQRDYRLARFGVLVTINGKYSSAARQFTLQNFSEADLKFFCAHLLFRINALKDTWSSLSGETALPRRQGTRLFTVPKVEPDDDEVGPPVCSSRTAPMPWGNLCPQDNNAASGWKANGELNAWLQMSKK